MGEFRDNHNKVNPDWRLPKNKKTGLCWKVNPNCTPYFWDLYADAVERRRTGVYD